MNDKFSNGITDREMLRRLLGQEIPVANTGTLRDSYPCPLCGAGLGQGCITPDGRATAPHQERWDQGHQTANIPDDRKDQEDQTVNNDDERDYEEEAHNRDLMHDTSEDPEGEDDGMRVIVFRVPVRYSARASNEAALADIRRIISRAWKRLAPGSELAGPVTVIPEEAPPGYPERKALSAISDALQDAAAAPGDTLARIDGALIQLAAALGSRDAPPADLPDGRAVTRQGHRAAALQLISDWADRLIRPGGPDSLTAALAHAVLALSAPDPDPDSTHDAILAGLAGWRQRATEAEAALTAIGGVMADEAHLPHRVLVRKIEHILRTSGREADRLMTTPATHTRPLAHDGFLPHSHEVRPDHEGVPREKP